MAQNILKKVGGAQKGDLFRCKLMDGLVDLASKKISFFSEKKSVERNL